MTRKAFQSWRLSGRLILLTTVLGALLAGLLLTITIVASRTEPVATPLRAPLTDKGEVGEA